MKNEKAEMPLWLWSREEFKYFKSVEDSNPAEDSSMKDMKSKDRETKLIFAELPFPKSYCWK